jgi:ribosomal protein S18 acetylase RimI-like enzyme
MEIRNAKKNDTGDIAELIYSSGVEVYDFIYKTNNKTALDYIGYEYKTGRGFCGYKNVTVAVDNGVVVGTGCFYDGNVYGKLVFGTLINMFLFYGVFEFRNIFNKSKHTSSVMKKPRKNQMYLSNFGVSENYRSKGIGSSMINLMIDKAKKANYEKFILDVSDKNTRAESLYLKKGFIVVKTKIFSGKAEGIDFSKSKQMELNLQSSVF